MSIKVYKIRWWAVILVLLGLAALMQLGLYWQQQQDEAMSLSDDPVEQMELKQDVQNRQTKNLIYGIVAVCLIWGIRNAIRQRRQR